MFSVKLQIRFDVNSGYTRTTKKDKRERVTKTYEAARVSSLSNTEKR